MSESGGEPSAGDVLIGIFTIVYGLCVTLAGGACAVVMAPSLSSLRSMRGGAGFVIISLIPLLMGVGMVVGGAGCIRAGARRARGNHRRKREDGGVDA